LGRLLLGLLLLLLLLHAELLLLLGAFLCVLLLVLGLMLVLGGPQHQLLNSTDLLSFPFAISKSRKQTKLKCPLNRTDKERWYRKGSMHFVQKCIIHVTRLQELKFFSMLQRTQ
jgi:hypothetical protein